METDRVRQQAAVASIGQRALMGANLSELMKEAAELVAETLNLEYCKILELLPDESGFLLRAGVGWKKGVIGKVVAAPGSESQAGYTLSCNHPVIVRDFRSEKRFRSVKLLRQHGVTSGLSVVIHGKRKPYGVLGADSLRKRIFSEDDVLFLQSVANAIGAAIEWERAESARLQYQDQLRQLASRLSLAEQQERLRIATSLHDHVAQALAMAQVKLGALQSHSGAPPVELEEIRRLLDQSIQFTRSLSFELSPPVLYDLGFESAVEWLAEHTEAEHGIRVVVTRAGRAAPLEEGVRMQLFAMLRELMTNVAKHSQCREARILLRRREGMLQVEVKDDGIGFDPALLSTQRGGSGFGLFSIRERLRNLGGSMEIHSSPGKGVRVVLTAPLHMEAEALS